MYEVSTMVMLLWLNKNAWLIYAVLRQRLIKTPGLHNRAIGQAFKDLIDEAFRPDRIWQNDLDRHGYDEWTISFKEKVALTLKQWWDKAGYEAQKLLRNLQQKAEQWWYFLHHPEIPPNHNLAERSLRLAITKRKVSGGSRSMERFQQTANLLTVVLSLSSPRPFGD